MRSGGIDGQSIADFAAAADEQLERLHQELKEKRYQPRAVRQQLIPKAGQPGKFRPPGIPTIYDRVCQQAALNRLEGIFEPIFDEAGNPHVQFERRTEASTARCASSDPTAKNSGNAEGAKEP